MDREFKSRIDEISGAFESWAKEVADRIVDAAQQGAEAAAKATNETRSDQPDSTSGFDDSHAERKSEGKEEDPWQDWANMRNETWSRWASGKFDRPQDADHMGRLFREAINRWGDSSFRRLCDEAFRQIEAILRRASEAGNSAEAGGPVEIEVIRPFVDADVAPVKEASRVETSKYAEKLIKRIRKLDTKGKPKKMIRSLIEELESDLKKLDKQKKK